MKKTTKKVLYIISLFALLTVAACMTSIIPFYYMAIPIIFSVILTTFLYLQYVKSVNKKR